MRILLLPLEVSLVVNTYSCSVTFIPALGPSIDTPKLAIVVYKI